MKPRLKLPKLVRKFLPCLRCRRTWFTDAAHRICPACQPHNAHIRDRGPTGHMAMRREVHSI